MLTIPNCITVASVVGHSKGFSDIVRQKLRHCEVALDVAHCRAWLWRTEIASDWLSNRTTAAAVAALPGPGSVESIHIGDAAPRLTFSRHPARLARLRVPGVSTQGRLALRRGLSAVDGCGRARCSAARGEAQIVAGFDSPTSADSRSIVLGVPFARG